MAVMPDTMNARPVRRAVASMASRGLRPRARSSTNRNRMRDVNSVQTATTRGPATAVTGLSLRWKANADERHRPDGHEHRHERQQRPDEAAQPEGEEDAHEQDGQVGELDPGRLEVLDAAHPDRGDATRRDGDPRRAG